jgi:BRCA1/BRCA2-containing complex subunit 3
VIVLDSVLEALLTHALTTEREEVLGLCFGHFYDEDPISKAKQSVVLISGMTTLRRRDKRPDRVEVSDGDLSGASAAAEKEGLRVVGWYHSHPRITLPPSHVDLRTQLLYQYLDARFVGLIVSAFDRTRGRIGLGAFQTMVSSSHDSSHPHRANANKYALPLFVIRTATSLLTLE